MAISFKRFRKREDGSELNGTINEMWKPVVNRKLRSDPQVAQLVVEHEKTHGNQGVNRWGDMYTEPEAHLAALRKLQQEGAPKKVRSGFGRNILRELEKRRELYVKAGGDLSFEPTPENREAMLRAGWKYDDEIGGNGSKEKR